MMEEPLKLMLCDTRRLVLLTDPTARGVPEWRGDSVIVAIEDCLAVGQRLGCDIDLTIGDAKDVFPGGQPIKTWSLKTPSGCLLIGDGDGELLRRIDVRQTRTPILIWVDSPQAPREITIGIFGEM